MSEDDDDDCSWPKVHVPTLELERFHQPWRGSLIVKLLGTSLSYGYMLNRLKQKWQLKGGHYLTMRRWKPEFQPNKERIKCTAVWIRFPEQPIEYFQSNSLFELVGQIGKILKVDKAIQDSERGKFSRICIEIELDKPLIPKIKIGKRWRRIEYEGFHMICFHCGAFGHSKEHSPTNVKVNNMGKRDSNVLDGPCDMASGRMPDDRGVNVTKTNYGPLVPQRGRRPKVTNQVIGQKLGNTEVMNFNSQSLRGVKEASSIGSRFGVLENEGITTPIADVKEDLVDVVQLKVSKQEMLLEQVKSLKTKVKDRFVTRNHNGVINQRKAGVAKGNSIGTSKMNHKVKFQVPGKVSFQGVKSMEVSESEKNFDKTGLDFIFGSSIASNSNNSTVQTNQWTALDKQVLADNSNTFSSKKARNLVLDQPKPPDPGLKSAGTSSIV
ncbi:reverse transcriptase [Quillaja saponaria]|uniref:Reverse transcriptase n=1 Tax=Quillaja saponaria TaxID=32244 RepID=A0AAD7LPH7_QUISA|nr:reverse transcriptase [Quillaja saponaria]